MTTLIMEPAILEAYAATTRAPIVSDRDLDAWADYYQREPILRGEYYFDLFITDPVRRCIAVGIPPFPFTCDAPDIGDMQRHLLPRQRFISGLTF